MNRYKKRGWRGRQTKTEIIVDIAKEKKKKKVTLK